MLFVKYVMVTSYFLREACNTMNFPLRTVSHRFGVVSFVVL